MEEEQSQEQQPQSVTQDQVPEQHPMHAIGLMMGAIFLLSTMDVAIKLLVEHYPSMQVVFFRCVVSAPVFALWIIFTEPKRFRTAYFKGHLVRGAIGLVMLYAVSECFRYLHLAEAYALFFAAPLVITLLSGPMLKEPAGPVRILLTVLGFSGVLVVLNPSAGAYISYGAAMGILGVICYSLTAILLRKLGAKDHTVTIAFWFTFLVGVGSGLIAIKGWQELQNQHWPLLLLLGITGTLGQVMITAAFRRASAAVVAPFDYTHMLWAVIYGATLWGHLPDSRTWVGSAIIVSSGLLIIYREHRLRNRQLARSSSE